MLIPPSYLGYEIGWSRDQCLRREEYNQVYIPRNVLFRRIDGLN